MAKPPLAMVLPEEAMEVEEEGEGEGEGEEVEVEVEVEGTSQRIEGAVAPITHIDGSDCWYAPLISLWISLVIAYGGGEEREKEGERERGRGR